VRPCPDKGKGHQPDTLALLPSPVSSSTPLSCTISAGIAVWVGLSRATAPVGSDVAVAAFCAVNLSSVRRPKSLATVFSRNDWNCSSVMVIVLGSIFPEAHAADTSDWFALFARSAFAFESVVFSDSGVVGLVHQCLQSALF